MSVPTIYCFSTTINIIIITNIIAIMIRIKMVMNYKNGASNHNYFTVRLQSQIPIAFLPVYSTFYTYFTFSARVSLRGLHCDNRKPAVLIRSLIRHSIFLPEIHPV